MMKKIIVLGLVALIPVLVALVLYVLFGAVKVAAAPIEPVPVEVIPVVESTLSEVIKEYFPENHRVMAAIFMAESSNNPEAKNWNCHYYNAEGKRYSRSCNKEDRAKAWSVDCGLAQINVRGKDCPAELLDPVQNVVRAAEKYEDEGYGAWVVYKTGAYRKYLKS